MTEEPLVHLSRPAEGVVVMTLDDPKRRNAMTAAMVTQMVEAVEAFESNGDAKVLIVTGAGPAFCAGADLSSLANAGSSEDSAAGLRDIYAGFLAIASATKPVIAAVNGPAVGARMNLAPAADVRITAPRANFDTRFAMLGIHPGGGHTWMLQNLVGPTVAKAMLLFGQTLDGEAAVTAGLSLRCVPAEDLIASALDLAVTAASLRQNLIVDIKRTLSETRWMADHSAAVERELLDQAESVRSPEFRAKLAR